MALATRKNEEQLLYKRSGGWLRRHGGLLDFGTRLLDLALVGAGGWLAYVWYLGSGDLLASYEVALLVGILIAALVFPRFGIYRTWRGGSILDELGRITLAWLTVSTVLVAIAFFAKIGADFSRVWGATWLATSWMLLMLSRIVIRSALHWARRHGLNTRTVVVVGAQGLGAEVAEHLMGAPWTGLQIRGLFGECERFLDGRGTIVAVHPNVTEVVDFVQREKIDQVWLALPLSQEQKILDLVDELRKTMADIRLVPEATGLRLLNRRTTDVAGLPVVDMSVSSMIGDSQLVKAVEDRVLALGILVLLSPLMLGIALAVRLSSKGPVFFRQKRHGWDGREIEIYKFRSMEVHDEEGGQLTQARRGDPRVTRVGAFLRRTSLDELPQFINVLQGRMSVVGPRPHAIEHNEYYRDKVEDYMRRHKVKPGITGWAQVNGYRGETDTLEKMQNRVEYDLYYIENWSVGFDLRIVLKTVFNGFVHRNAY